MSSICCARSAARLIAWITLGLCAGQTASSQTPTPRFISPFSISPDAGVSVSTGFWNVSNLVAGDIDGDGKPDLLVSVQTQSNLPNYVEWLKGKGDGTFVGQPLPGVTGYRYNLRLADLNGDGILDLVTSSFQPNELDVFIGNGNGTFHSPVTYLAGASITDILVADFNGDNHVDMAVTTTSGSQILMNNGDGTFRTLPSATITGGTFLGAADFNGDHHMDVMVGNGGRYSVFFGVGDGTFTAGPFNSFPSTLSFAEFPAQVLDANRDGRPDLVVSLWDRAYVMLGNGDGTFRNTETLQKPLRYVAGVPRQDTRNFYVMTGDFNRDGIADFAVGPSVYFGNGDGTFRISKFYAVSGTSEIAYDVNKDGNTDLLWVDTPGGCCGGYVNVALGTGGGLFRAPLETVAPNLISDTSVPPGTQPIVAGDFTRDGIEDVAVACHGGSLCVFPGTGKSFFNPMVVYPAYFTGPLAAGDLNGDGILDIVATNDANSTHTYDAVVFLGKPDGTFATANTYTLFSKPGAGLFAFLIDVNNDHKLDLVGAFGVALGKGDGTFLPAQPLAAAPSFVWDMAWGDFNRDGNLDLAIDDRTQIHILPGNGTGAFTRDMVYTLPSPYHTIDGLAVADVNKDGIPDLLFTALQQGTGAIGLTVVQGKGDGTFGAPAAFGFPSHFCCYDGDKVFVADLDRDGITDVIVTEYSYFEYFRGLPGGTFAAPIEYANTQNQETVPPINTDQFAFLDVNGDGYLDLVVADQYFGIARVLNTGLPAK